jgi:hypothetical protein
MKKPLLPLSAAVRIALLIMAADFWRSHGDGNPPERMTYQGFLVNANGMALGMPSPKNYDVIFRIYDAQSLGNLKWSEQQTITVDQGYFSVLLGEGAPVGSESHPNISTIFTGPDAADRFIGITVKGIGSGGTDADILPRLRMLSAPYSYLARKAMTLDDGANIISGTVPEARLSPNVAFLNKPQTFSALQSFGSGVGITGANTLELGQGVSNKDPNAGKIGYGTFTANTLDIVGVGDSATRAIKLWAEGGLTVAGPVSSGAITTSGGISSPKFKVTAVLPSATGNWSNRTGNFTSAGGTLVITMSVTGYSATAGVPHAPVLQLDNSPQGGPVMFLNQAYVHTAFPVRTFVITGKAAGSHSIWLDTNGLIVDSNDYSEVTVVEYPF